MVANIAPGNPQCIHLQLDSLFIHEWLRHIPHERPAIARSMAAIHE